MLSPYNQYKKVQITTSNREKILIMLYDSAINFTKISIDKLANGDVAGKGLYIGKALAIVTELKSSLNYEVGGDIALQLAQLYSYLIREFTTANLKNAPVHLENVLRILNIMRNTWLEAVEIVKKEREAASVQPMRRVG